MAITHVATFGTNSNKTTGTTLAVTATASPQPAVGELIIVSCSRDDIANDPLTGDSLSDGHGNSYTRIINTGAGGTDATPANNIIVVSFWCVLTVAWSGSTTVTWTHPSVDARAMRVEHFAPEAGYTLSHHDTQVGDNLGNPDALTGATVPASGDLVFGVLASETPTGTTWTGDSDTSNGSWSALTSPVGTTGGVANTNATILNQWKIVTASATQTWNVTTGTTQRNANLLVTFKQTASASTVNGTATADFTFAAPAVGTRTVAGTAATDLTFAAPAVGTIGVTGVAATDLVFAAPAVGTVEHPGTATADITFTAPAVGSRTVLGTAATDLVFDAPAVGTTGVTGAAATDLTFNAPALGTVEHPGQATADLTFAAPAVGTRTVAGTASADLVFAAPAAGARVVSGTAAAVFVFAAPAVGTVESPAEWTEVTAERRPDVTTSARRPDASTTARRPDATTSARRRSVPA